MEPKPKERIVFDEDLYYGDEGEEMAINDLMERDGLTEGEVREDFTEDFQSSDGDESLRLRGGDAGTCRLL